MKRIWLGILLIMFTCGLFACDRQEDETIIPEDYACKDTPLAPNCYIPSGDLDFISPVPDEYVISETFETDRINQMPRNWLLYRNEEYKADGVKATVLERDDNQFVKLYSDGLKAPMYPQSAPTPTFIFSTKFNLDQDRKGVAYASILIPSDEQANSVTFGVSTGAVNAIAISVGLDLRVSVKIGGPFFYYSGTADGGDTYSTSQILTKDTWYQFKFTWDASINQVQAYILSGETEILLHQGEFHISNRVNARSNGVILVPNVFKVTMPRYQSGYVYLDDVIVERKG